MHKNSHTNKKIFDKITVLQTARLDKVKHRNIEHTLWNQFLQNF